MGREINKKEIIRAMDSTQLNNINIAETTLSLILNLSIMKLFEKQFMLVKPFIVAMKLFINNPEKATEEALEIG